MRKLLLLACLALAAPPFPATAGDATVGPCFEDWWRAEVGSMALASTAGGNKMKNATCAVFIPRIPVLHR